MNWALNLTWFNNIRGSILEIDYPPLLIVYFYDNALFLHVGSKVLNIYLSLHLHLDSAGLVANIRVNDNGDPLNFCLAMLQDHTNWNFTIQAEVKLQIENEMFEISTSQSL